MESLDKKTLIHAGIELIAFGGLTVWMMKKTGGLQDKITLLEQENSQLKEALRSHQQALMKHEQILNMIIGEPPQGNHLREMPPVTTSPPANTRQFVKPEPEPEDVSDEELDKIIEMEEKSQPKSIEIECHDGVCEVPKRHKKKDRE